MAKKKTIVEQYNEIIEKVEDVLTAEELQFLEERKDAHAKKNSSRKPTKAQEENENIKSSILEFMEIGKPYTISEIQKAMGLATNQKTSALVSQLRLAHLVIRTEEKGKAYFTKA